jgi:diaminohydroxyphosphoribosylaminopyrimidine deaminase/5-amino-6-(5-phosphoribosylamino)uracil reductase
VDAILTGVGTVLADDPMLTARSARAPRRIAQRIVIDPQARTPRDSALVRSAGSVPVVIVCGPGASEPSRSALAAAGVEVVEAPPGPGGLDLAAALRALAARFDLTTVLVEAGPRLLGSICEADLADALLVYVAPMLLADAEALPAASGRAAPALAGGRRFELVRARPCAGDIELAYTRSG